MLGAPLARYRLAQRAAPALSPGVDLVSVRPAIVILGGGFTGVATAVALARRSAEPVDITVVEPRAEVGRGVAYSARHPDHRLNAPSALHFVTPDEPDALDRWFHARVGLVRDPEAEAFDGSLFVRRSDFGAFVLYEFERHRVENPSGSTLFHRRAAAVDVTPVTNGFEVVLDDGARLRGNAVVVTTSNDRPSVPPPFAGAFDGHPAFLADPWDVDAIEAIPHSARVLMLGAGLTAADVVAALARQGHHGRITLFSRRGLRPTSRPRMHAGQPQPLLERARMDPSVFAAKHGHLGSVRAVLGAVREDVARAQAEGLPWQKAFDDLRDSVLDVWTALPITEKKRYMRHLRHIYDVHRFRYPPQTEAQLDAAEADGVLERRVGRLHEAVDSGGCIKVTWRERGTGRDFTEVFGAVVCCTGPETRPDRTANPLLHALLDRGLARPSPLEVGLDVGLDSRALDADGRPTDGLFVVGPLTFATFGWPLGVPFIALQADDAAHGILRAAVARSSRVSHR